MAGLAPFASPLGVFGSPLAGGSGGSTSEYNHQSSGSSIWDDSNVFLDWLFNRDTYGHNEAIYAWQRESSFNAQEAEKARQFEKMMSDTQFQRKVADYVKAGFSPLAALEGNGSYTVSSAPAASAHASPGAHRGNNFGSIITALIGTIAAFATQGISSAASGASNASKAALDAQKLDILHDQVDVQKGWLDLAKNGRRSVSAIAAEKALRKASHGHSSPTMDWDKLLDDLEKI